MSTSTAPVYPGFGPELYQQVCAPGLGREWGKLYEWFRDQMVFELPPEVQDQMSFFFPGAEATRPDHGLVRRGEPGDDQKWFIHIRPYEVHHRKLGFLFSQLSAVIPNFPIWFREFQEWNYEVEKLFAKTYVLVENFAIEAFPPEFGILELLRHPEARQKHLVRMLHYDPQPKGRVLASLHRDFGLITADCYTSHPGLCFSRDQVPLSPDFLVEEKADHVFLFPGRKAEDVLGLHGLCHGVISTAEVPRGAVVVFLHGPGPMGLSCPS